MVPQLLQLQCFHDQDRLQYLRHGQFILNNHSELIEYAINDEAPETFEAYHDNLVTRQSRQHNENIQGILSEARGFTARLSMVLFALEQAIEFAGEHDEDEGEDSDAEWSNEITQVCVEAATTIMDYLISQKLIMMDLEEVTANTIPSDDMCTTPVPQASWLKKLLLSVEDPQGTISPSNLTRSHICVPVMGKYKVEKAIELFT